MTPHVCDAAPTTSRGPFLDLLRVPILGRFLKWRRSRLVLQIPLLVISGIMIAHAFFGPQLAPKNLAALLTWVHFRGMVVFVLLVCGNLFCMACPFLVPRELSRLFFNPRWEWPLWLRNKWPAILLFVFVLFVYELFDLWGDPWWTGVMIVGYFAAATAVDALFTRASFCKYVCPIGQFNFLSATLSPFEVAVRNQNVCQTCDTKDCIRGVPGPDRKSMTPHRITQRGCELALFQPQKVGNLDCTFCLDCVYACPHDNVGIIARLPADELTVNGNRSGIRSVERRFDFSVLAIVFTFGAILNAFAMISPVYALEQWIARQTGLRVEWPILGAIFAVALILEPALLLCTAAWISRRLGSLRDSLLMVINRFARSLIPLGFGIWLAHYGFHFFTGFLTVIPVTQYAVDRALGAPLLGEPAWHMGGLEASTVFPLEVGFMAMGLLGSLYVAWSIARDSSVEHTARVFAPWAVLYVLLFTAALWIMNQPMDMRGTLLTP